MSIANPRLLISKTVAVAAIVLGAGVLGAAVAVANPEPDADQPNPFGSLGCSCQEPAGGPLPGEQIDRGIRDGSHGLAMLTPRTQ
jgi:hypothetical protein